MPTPVIINTEEPINHPMVKEQIVLMLPMSKITNMRPNRSERAPVKSDAGCDDVVAFRFVIKLAR